VIIIENEPQKLNEIPEEDVVLKKHIIMNNVVGYLVHKKRIVFEKPLRPLVIDNVYEVQKGSNQPASVAEEELETTWFYFITNAYVTKITRLAFQNTLARGTGIKRHCVVLTSDHSGRSYSFNKQSREAYGTTGPK
jgi:hypothetical protein